MRRIIAVLVVFVLLVPVSVISAQNPNKTDVCHLDEEGNFNVISVANASLSSHLGHGDQVIGVDVDENCEPLAFEPAAGCYGSDGTFPWEFYYNGVANTSGNLTIYNSADGTCTGGLSEWQAIALVLADTQDEASAICIGFGFQFGWSGATYWGLPNPPVWLCSY